MSLNAPALAAQIGTYQDQTGGAACTPCREPNPSESCVAHAIRAVRSCWRVPGNDWRYFVHQVSERTEPGADAQLDLLKMRSRLSRGFDWPIFLVYLPLRFAMPQVFCISDDCLPGTAWNHTGGSACSNCLGGTFSDRFGAAL